MNESYPWLASKLDENDMAILYKIKQRVKKPITVPKFIIKLIPGKEHANVQSQDPTNTG